MTSGLVLVFAFFILVALNVPIGFSIGLSTLFALVTIMPFDPASTAMAQRMIAGLDSFTLLAIPFFIFMGTILEKSRLAEELLGTIGVLFGPFRGGRVTAVAGVPGKPHTFLQGASGGGVWRTDDAWPTSLPGSAA